FQAVAGHPHHDDAGVDLPDPLPAEPQVVHDPGGVVLGDDVGRGDQPLQQLAALGPGEVEGEVPLVEVHRTVPARLVPALSELRRGHVEPETIRTLHRLDLDDVGAHGPEVGAVCTTGPEGSQVDD